MELLAFAPAIPGLPGVPGIPPPRLEDKVGPVPSTISPPKLRKSFPETWIWDNINEEG